MVRITEVGPRDGLQNEPTPIPIGAKVAFVRGLVDAGLGDIEATSFVSPRHVPQMADADQLWRQLPIGPRYSSLVPNRQGLDRALAAGVERIALFTAASDAFCEKNIGMDISESLAVFADVIGTFRALVPGGFVRGYVSTAFQCPYAGKTDPLSVAEVAWTLRDMGCDEIAVADTIGVASPGEVRAVARALHDHVPARAVSWHFHDTNGTAIANVAEALALGHAGFDASAGGLGGCPFAPGAGGNLATEDLVYFLERSGIPTGVNLERLAESSLPILELLGRVPASKAQAAALARRATRG